MWLSSGDPCVLLLLHLGYRVQQRWDVHFNGVAPLVVDCKSRYQTSQSIEGTLCSIISEEINRPLNGQRKGEQGVSGAQVDSGKSIGGYLLGV
jgi:hypothetical protein